MSILENSGHTTHNTMEFREPRVRERDSRPPPHFVLVWVDSFLERNICAPRYSIRLFRYENGSLFSLVHFFLKKGTPKCGQLKEFVWLWLTHPTARVLCTERLRELACNNNHLAQFLHEKKICLFFLRRVWFFRDEKYKFWFSLKLQVLSALLLWVYGVALQLLLVLDIIAQINIHRPEGV